MTKILKSLMVFSILLLGYINSNAQCSVNAGSDIPVCPQDPLVRPIGYNLGTSVVSINWSSTGTGTFVPDAISATSSYSPSPADRASGLTKIILNITNGCGFGTDTLNVYYTSPPTVNAGVNRNVCGNSVQLNGITNQPAAVWSHNGYGSFNNAGSLNAIYTAHPSDLSVGSVRLILSATELTCSSTKDDTVEIFFSSPVTVNAGIDKVECGIKWPLSGTTSGNLNAVTWTTSGTGTFSPSPKFLYATYLPSAADLLISTVTLTLSSNADPSCTAVSDNVIITFSGTSGPIVDAGIDKIVTGAFSLSGAISGATGGIWTSSGTGTFSPSNTDLAATYSPSVADVASGLINFKLTSTGNGVCQAASDLNKVVFGGDFSISGKVTGNATDLDNGLLVVFKKTASLFDFVKVETINPGNTGNYTVDSLSMGSYMLVAIPTSTMMNNFLPTYFGNTDNWVAAQLLVITTSDLTNKNISLVSFSSAIANWNSGADTIRGQVVLTIPLLKTTAVSPITMSNVIVYLKDKNGNNVAYAITKEDGSYYFPKVKAGEYSVGIEFGGTDIVGSDKPLTVDGLSATSETVKLSINRASTVNSIIPSLNNRSAFISPNPAVAFIKVSIDETIQVKGEARIIDAMGNVSYASAATIEAGGALELPIANLASGCYVVEILTENSVFKSKFIKY